MPRAFWKGAISFGMVVIPVKMYVATESKQLSFHLLHKKCLTRPKQMLYCSVDNEYFTSQDTVKGYEYTKGEYVVLKDSDFEKVPIRTNHTIEILGFVEASEINPLYYYGSHYLQAEDIAIRPYALLREALRKTKRVGIAKVVLQRREHLCSLQPLDNMLTLYTLHYKSEIRPSEELSPPRQEIAQGEMDMASTLINAMSKSFKPEEYKDEYQEALQKVVQAKIQGVEIKALPSPRVEVPDLMAALRASIEAAKKASEAVPAGTAAER